MISLICFAALFALICRAKGFWRIVMLALAVPVAVVCNIARITSQLLTNFPVLDLTIEDPPIDDVIERVFESGLPIT